MQDSYAGRVWRVLATLSLYARVARVIIIQIFTIASARRASSEPCRLPTEIAPGEYLLSAPLFVNRCLAPPPPPPAHRATGYTPLRRLIIEHFSRFCCSRCAEFYLIVPRKRHVRSEDVIKESLETSWRRIECMNTEFMVLAATTINNPTFVSLSSASFSYPSYAILPSHLLPPPLSLSLFLFLSRSFSYRTLTKRQDSVFQH